MRRCLVAVAVAFVMLVGVGSTQAAGPATVSGTLGGATLPRSGAGGAFVRATSLPDFSIVAATRVARNGRYALKLPKGEYALTSTLVRPGAALLQTSVPVRLRAGQRLKLPLSLKRKKKTKKQRRRRARGSGVNKYGYSYTGTAIAFDHFKGATGDLAVLNAGLSSLLVVGTVNASTTCELKVIEWERRQDLIDEVARQQGPEFDPSTRLNPHKRIDPELFVRGDIAVSGPESNQTLAITARVEDAKTGAVRGATTLQTTVAHFFDDVDKLAEQIGQVVCHLPDKDVPAPPRPPTPPPPPALPSAYRINVSVAGTLNQGGATSSGTINASLVLQRSATEGPNGLVTYSGTGQMAWADVTGTYPKCTFNSAKSTPVTWTVKLQAFAILPKLSVLSWLPYPDLPKPDLNFDCVDTYGDPYTTTGAGPWLKDIQPNAFELPVGGGTQPVSGGYGGLYTNTGTVTLTPQP